MRDEALSVLVVLAVAAGCQAGGREGGPTAALAPGASAGAAGASGGGRATGGTGGVVAGAEDGGVGLTSSVFGSLEELLGTGGENAVAACDYGASPGCDFTRAEGCCSHLSCVHATDDPYDVHPVEACEALVACVQSHPGCSSAADPLCFQDENPDGPCLTEAYTASHEDPEGPFAFTEDLMRCICGY